MSEATPELSLMFTNLILALRALCFTLTKEKNAYCWWEDFALTESPQALC